jgi:Ca2+-binding RTX toxin-like protein
MPFSSAIDLPRESPVRRLRRVVLVALLTPAFAAATAQASTIEVRDGALTIVQAAGEQTTVILQRTDPYIGETTGSWLVLPPKPSNTGPGAPPALGAGCAPEPWDRPQARCIGAVRVEMTFGGGHDYVYLVAHEAVGPGGPIRILGGDGDHELHVDAGPGEIMIDGGAGNDTLSALFGTVLGGPGMT